MLIVWQLTLFFFFLNHNRLNVCGSRSNMGCWILGRGRCNIFSFTLWHVAHFSIMFHSLNSPFRFLMYTFSSHLLLLSVVKFREGKKNPLICLILCCPWMKIKWNALVFFPSELFPKKCHPVKKKRNSWWSWVESCLCALIRELSSVVVLIAVKNQRDRQSGANPVVEFQVTRVLLMWFLV